MPRSSLCSSARARALRSVFLLALLLQRDLDLRLLPSLSEIGKCMPQAGSGDVTGTCACLCGSTLPRKVPRVGCVCGSLIFVRIHSYSTLSESVLMFPSYEALLL